jgi:hypothetical protein
VQEAVKWRLGLALNVLKSYERMGRRKEEQEARSIKQQEKAKSKG